MLQSSEAKAVNIYLHVMLWFLIHFSNYFTLSLLGIVCRMWNKHTNKKLCHNFFCLQEKPCFCFLITTRIINVFKYFFKSTLFSQETGMHQHVGWIQKFGFYAVSSSLTKNIVYQIREWWWVDIRMLGTANSDAGKQRHRRERERSQLLGECVCCMMWGQRGTSVFTTQCDLIREVWLSVK